MNDQILKIQWERYEEHINLSPVYLKSIIKLYISDEIVAIKPMTEGCANTNYKISFKRHIPVVFRIYTRDSRAMGREADIFRVVHEHVPVPSIIALDDTKKHINYSFGIFTYIRGISMRELVLAGDEKIISACCIDAGRYLAALSNIRFPKQGFFEENLKIKYFMNNYINYFMAQLEDRNIKRELGKNIINKLQKLIYENEKYLPDINQANLTHGDYDPANIKVGKIKNRWGVVGILDWEFAFSGSYYFDIGTMLRFSHKLPKYYERSFITGLEQHGLKLPQDWRKYARLIDLLSLLQLLRFNSKDARPKLNSDVTALIKYTLNNWE